MPDVCAGGYLTGVLQGPFEAWKVVVSVATSALWLLCGFIFRRGARRAPRTCAYRKMPGHLRGAGGALRGENFARPLRIFISLALLSEKNKKRGVVQEAPPLRAPAALAAWVQVGGVSGHFRTPLRKSSRPNGRLGHSR